MWLVLLGVALLRMTSVAAAGSLEIKCEEDIVSSFDARGMSYAEIYKVVAFFCGVDEALAASPPDLMQLTAKGKTWPEIMLMLHDEKTFNVQRNSNGKLVVTRVLRK